jgi:Zn-dependent protease
VLFAGFGPSLVYVLFGILVAMDLHEFSHALVASWLGDDTPRKAGRLSLDPRAHLDPIGTVGLLLIGLGWGKPVGIDPEKLRPGPRVGMAIVGLAGPVCNLIVAAVLALPLRLHLVPFMPTSVLGFPFSWGELFAWVIWFNLLLAVFNLIPFSPLDGSRLLAAVLPQRWFLALSRVEVYAFVLLLGLILLERFSNLGLLSAIVGPPIDALWWALVGMSPPSLGG